MEYAVLSEPDGQLLFEALEMYIARFLLYRLKEERIDELDNRGFVFGFELMCMSTVVIEVATATLFVRLAQH